MEGFIVFIFGLCIGSFLNVCIHRLPKDKSVITPRSFCPSCGNTVKWYDNIPIFSYILLKAKCRACNRSISFRYPLVEVLTASLFFILYVKIGLSLALLKFVFLFCLLIVISFIDIDYHAIPAYMCVLGIAIGLIFSFLESKGLLYVLMDFFKFIYPKGVKGWGQTQLSAFFSSLVVTMFGLGFGYLFKLFGDIFVTVLLYLRKEDSIEGEKESLGLGDVDFMGMIGAFFGSYGISYGVKSVMLVFFLAPFFALIYSIFAIIFKKSHLIPYLPYLSAATLVVFFWGTKILDFIF